MLEDKTAGTCPECGGRLFVDSQYPDRVYCDTCEWDEEEEEEDSDDEKTDSRAGAISRGRYRDPAN